MEKHEIVLAKLGEKFSGLDAYIHESHEDIKNHLRRLNGKVGENVLEITKLRLWQARTMGACGILTVLMLGIIIPTALSFIGKLF